MTHTVKYSPGANRLRPWASDMTSGECAEGKSFVDTLEEVGVGSSHSSRHTHIQLREVADVFSGRVIRASELIQAMNGSGRDDERGYLRPSTPLSDTRDDSWHVLLQTYVQNPLCCVCFLAQINSCYHAAQHDAQLCFSFHQPAE